MLKSLKKADSEQIFNEFCNNGFQGCDAEDTELREDIRFEFESVTRIYPLSGANADSLKKYKVDCLFGLKLYELLNEKYEMNPRIASDDGVWRYLTLCVCPDIVEQRYGVDHPDRFWKKPKRLWLRQLWWYVHLSWQGDISSTYSILQNNSTDEIAQLVDRCGRTGYRVELYREIMRHYGQLKKEERPDGIFRKIMVLNTAKVEVVEPGLVSGGEAEYVLELYKYLEKKTERVVNFV